MIAVPLVSALVASLLLIPIIRVVSVRLGMVAAPREDRWNKKSTPILGGIGIFLATLAGVLLTVVPGFFNS